jgi:LPS-assembly protein
VNIKFYNKPNIISLNAIGRKSFLFQVPTCIKKIKVKYPIAKWLPMSTLALLMLMLLIYHQMAYPAAFISEPVKACVIPRNVDLTDAIRAKFSQCLGWQPNLSAPICLGSYQPLTVTPLDNAEEIRALADRVSFYRNRRSKLSGHVEIQQSQRIISAQTAYIYRDIKTNQVIKIEFLGNVRYLEPGKLLVARKAIINPQDKSGTVEDALYRFNADRNAALLPAWGRASLIQRFANKNYLLRQATYTTCAPKDKAWDIQAQTITIDNAKAIGVARNARLRIHDQSVLYTPYLSFPTNKDRKSGFLIPIADYTNIGGFDLGLPYYWNIAPNYDLTLVPHIYTKRGLMLGGEYRFLTGHSQGMFNGNILPKDRVFNDFLQRHEVEFPQLQGYSSNRWAYGIQESTRFTSGFLFNLNLQEVSDDYYLQDFSTNLSVITQRQLLRQADLSYSTEHWNLRGMVQSYQTLNPVNEVPIAPAYERLPQLMARGNYNDLPFNANLNVLGQYDQYHWPTSSWVIGTYQRPQGPRFHLNPILTFPIIRSWGYITPSAQFVDNYYEVSNNIYFGINKTHNVNNENFNRLIPRFSADGGLYFDRNFSVLGNALTQTLEPRLFYLNVPFQNQTRIPVYDSGFMIFNEDQLFRTNRFSGFDRIGDANQLTYAVTTRWLSEVSGAELASMSVGQIKYFSDRKVQLCQSVTGYCIDNPNAFGGLSSTYGFSPIAARALYHVIPSISITGDYIWDPATNATNNADLNLHYQPVTNTIINLGYSYLINGDMAQLSNYERLLNGYISPLHDYNNNALHQALLSFVVPLNDKWSTIGAYSHNISKNYSMMSLFGFQYDSCCWAMRVLGGRTFKNLNTLFEPQYNSNVYFQIVLKGLGSVATSDPNNILSTYIPGYNDPFKR